MVSAKGRLNLKVSSVRPGLQQPGFQMFIYQDIETIEFKTALFMDAGLLRRCTDGWPKLRNFQLGPKMGDHQWIFPG